jgi:hypothetical protein
MFSDETISVKLAGVHLLDCSIKIRPKALAAGDKNVSERPQHLGNFIVVSVYRMCHAA